MKRSGEVCFQAKKFLTTKVLSRKECGIVKEQKEDRY